MKMHNFDIMSVYPAIDMLSICKSYWQTLQRIARFLIFLQW